VSAREVSRSELADQIPEILSGRNTLAIVPLTPDTEWTSAVTWEFARAVATEYRSVTLINLGLDDRVLDSGSGVAVEEGIVDAFQYGSSLTHVTVADPETGLNFVGAGTFTSEPAAIWNNSRWPQVLEALSRPHSIVIFFLPPEALDQLNVVLDGLILASPGGYNPRAESASREVNRAIAGGIPLLRVVTEQVTETPTPPAAAAPAPVSAVKPAGQRAPWIYVALAVVVVASIWYSVFGGRGTVPEAPEPAAQSEGEVAPPIATVAQDSLDLVEPDSAEGATNPPPPPETETTLPARAAAFTAADSLYWGVQAASLGSVERAIEYVERLNDGGFEAAVTPVRLSTGALWYRIVAGAEPDSAAAAALHTTLWGTPLLREPEGQVTRTPWTLEAEDLPQGPIEDVISGLRERGLAAYILPAADGTPRLLFGAFRTPGQAAIADSIISASGIATTLVQRLGNSQ
jgi:cell division septation protein DedD